MEEGKTYRLEDLTIDGKGHYGIGAPAVDFDENKFTYLRITDINDDGSINYSGLKSVDDPEAGKYLLKEGDIVFARTGNSTGRSYYYEPSDGQFVFAGFLIKFSLDPVKVNPRYLKYYTHSQAYYEWVKSFDTGATRGNINAQTYGAMEISLPPRTVQDRLVEVLSSIDDKIKLNNRINHNLEEQARSLYKSWFVDFEPFKDGKFVDSELGMIPEGWHIGTLSEIADIAMGQSPSGSSFNEDGHGIVFYQGRTEFGFRFPSIKLFTTEPTRFAEPHSVLMSVRAPVGDINVALDRCCIGRGLAAITAKDEAFSFVLYTLKGKSSELDLYNGEGTVFGSINRKDLEGLSVLIPPMSIIQQFNDCIRPIDESIEIACKEIVNLSFSRDSLLPRLMSGQLSFDECDC